MLCEKCEKCNKCECVPYSTECDNNFVLKKKLDNKIKNFIKKKRGK